MRNARNIAKLAYAIPAIIGFSTVITAVLLAFLLTVGPVLEGKYFPVTSNVAVQHIRTEDQIMYFQAWGTKNRHCALTSVKALIKKKGATVLSKAAIWPHDDGVGDTERPVGAQDLGIWAITPEAEFIEVQTTYNCHPFWPVHQVLGAWPAQDIKNANNPALESINIDSSMSPGSIIQAFRADIKRLQSTVLEYEAALNAYRKESK